MYCTFNVLSHGKVFDIIPLWTMGEAMGDFKN
jgi:hypothetical protein